MTCFTASTLRSAGVALAGLWLAQMPAAGQAPKVVEPAEAKNMRLVGFNDLQARSAYQPTIHKQGDRYIAYVGHHGASYDGKPVNTVKGVPEFNGTSIVDVTDPVKPKYLAHIPGAEGGPETGGAQMTRVCDGGSLPRGDANAVYLYARSVAWRTKSGMSPIPPTPSSSCASAVTTRIRTKAGGSATPGSPFWFPACRAGERSGCSKSTISAIRQSR
jgi:hypothetical protein